MPLLHKQKFVPVETPKDLDPDQEIFFSKQTREIFLDYDEYFERTILCNSLVWTCALTGKQGLTFSEALDSEKRARKHLAAFPDVLKKSIIYLISLTKRGNIKDLVDDIFGFTKDRYFLGENILLAKDSGSKADLQKTCKVIDIILPYEQNKTLKNDKMDESMDVDNINQDLNRSSQRQSSQNVTKNNNNNNEIPTDGLKINSDKIKYIIEIESKINGSTSTQTLRGPLIKRPQNQLTKDKINIIVKTYMKIDSGIWLVTERANEKFQIDSLKYTDFFRGEPPKFDVTYGRGQFSRKSLDNKSMTNGRSNSKSMKNSKSKSCLNDSKSKSGSKNRKKSSPVKENVEKTLKKSSKSSSKIEKEKQIEEIEEVPQERINEVLVMKLKDMTDEEFFIWRDYKPDEELKELVQYEKEIEKTKIREEMAKEKERLKQEKIKEKQELLEAKKPKEDFENEDLKSLPRASPVGSKITQSMMGDSILILEFLNNFGHIFELSDDFPNGFDFALLENALFSKSCDSALCNILLFFLDSVFKCFDEETFEELTEEINDNKDDKEIVLPNDSDDEEIGLEQLFCLPFDKEDFDRENFAMAAENYSQLIKIIQGRSVKKIGLDVYTITEMLRLYFITSGSEHLAKKNYWYQQRGGYTRMDEIGIDFSLNEKSLLKKLENNLVYELEAEEKLKILTSLCHQLISQVRFRDLTEDNLQKLSVYKGQLRDLHYEENRRLREEASFQWKKRNEDRVKEKTRIEEIKTNTGSDTSQKSSEQIKKETDTCIENFKQMNEAEYAKFLNESNVKREIYIKKEKNILNEIYELHYKCSMYPIGKDRYYRRYWVFKSFPGVFVEDNYELEKIDELLDNNPSFLKYKSNQEMLKSHESESAKEQKPIIDNLENSKNMDDSDYNITNDNQINGKENKPLLSDLTNLNNTSQLTGQNLTKTEQSVLSNNSETENSVKSELSVSSLSFIPKMPEYNYKDEPKWSFYNKIDDIEILIVQLNERGIRESELKQNLIDLKDKIFDNLNKKSLMIKNLTLSKEDIEKSIESCLKENINSVLANNLFHNPNKNKRQATKIAASLAVNNFSEFTSKKCLEVDLHDKLLDFEEQIFIGSLGTLKNADRQKWKDSLDTTKDVENNDESMDTIKKKLKILCTGLLQLEKSVERRFLRTPLGENQNTPSKKRTKPVFKGTSENKEDEYQILHNWEKSLMHCTNYSQVFVHLQSLDESIAWSKSAMNTRCRICRKKGDAEKMLLCDKCDHGHHMYCLRPQLKLIPDDQWFCPECKPKDVERTPRKIRDSFKDGQRTDFCNSELYALEDSQVEPLYVEESQVEDETMEDVESDNSDGEESEKNSGEENSENEDDDEDTENQTQNESTAEEDHNESDILNTKSKVKFNGFKIKNKNKIVQSENDEDMIEDSSENEKRSTRKRKITEEKPQPTKVLKAKEVENLISSSGRTTRGKKPVYNEISGEDDVTDEEQAKKRNGKKTKKGETSGEEEIVLSTSSRNTDVEQRLKITEKLLTDLMKHDDGWPFLKPVSKRAAPDYFEVIKKPMDFSTIKNNINNFKYNDYTNIIEDTRLVFQNCREYNEPGSEIYDACMSISKFFESEAKKAGLLDTKQLALPKLHK